MKHFTKEMIIRYFSTIIPHFHCQSQLQDDRNTFYRILHQIFLNRLDGNDNFIYLYLFVSSFYKNFIVFRQFYMILYF